MAVFVRWAGIVAGWVNLIDAASGIFAICMKGDMMKPGGIDSGRIEAMLVQLRTAASAAASRPTGLESPIKAGGATAAPQVNFADALKSQINSVAELQSKSAKLEKNFQMGDDSVSLSDVLIAGQKAGIAFQTTLQVRNRLVSAYRDIMNMQV